jgi:ABC-2 type transport system ATP-binding protein
MVLATGLRKSFGDTTALDDLSLEIAQGEIRALLGPNGAGKTTLVRILATLLKPDSGQVVIAGIDALRAPRAVQALIGLSGQSASVDDKLTGRENLTMFGRLQRLSSHHASARAGELLDEFGLQEVAGKAVKTYSGGTRRRLDLAASLIVGPPVVFLDEPTSGLDPSARRSLWSAIRTLVDGGTTVLLTTHDLDEADHLADSITIINRGRVVAEGSASDLKTQVGGTRFAITAPDAAAFVDLRSLLGERASTADARTRTLTVPGSDRGVDGLRELRVLIDQVAASAIPVEEFAIRKPTLDDVFQELTGAGRSSVDRDEGRV